jgi:hypothetical protein
VTRNRDIYGDDTDYEREYKSATTKLCSAVALIEAIRDDQKEYPGAACDAWLGANGYETEQARRARLQKERDDRAVQLDREIERLRQQRATLR